MTNCFDFSARKVLLTGGTRGIGLEMTRLLVSRGARVITIGRDAAALRSLEAAYPGLVSTLAADLSQADEVKTVIDWMAGEHPDCSVLINNAATASFSGAVRLTAISSAISASLVGKGWVSST